jgi:putative ABC transport system substrate-binding protein
MKGEKMNKPSTFLIVVLLVVTCVSCQSKEPESFTIGIVNYVPSLAPIIDGFKAGMTELGYVEGENVTYIYNADLGPDPQIISRELEDMLAQGVDLILAVGNEPAIQARQIVKETGTPVVFAPATNPIEIGIVDDIRHPGGNLTGVQTGNFAPKAMEWLLRIVPGTTKVYSPYHPQDPVSISFHSRLDAAATALGVETMFDEVQSAEEAVAAIKTLSAEDTGICLVPMPSLQSDSSNIEAIIEAAIERSIPVGTIQPKHLKLGALYSYALDDTSIGKDQAARLADQILQGTDPGNLPVEMAAFYLSINMQTAQALGLDIPDTVLRQATTIIR